MKKLFLMMMLMVFGLALVGCQDENNPTNDPIIVDDTYILLMEAEDLSGMASKTKVVITEDGSLNLPTTYKGVNITYTSRLPEIISNTGEVTRPSTCWIESRDQQGISRQDLVGLNDNWPVVLDVTLTLNGQTRTAKLLFVVAPREGFTCNNYKG
ncbi:hypothetical protein [Paracholeplasma manati]|uniref:hypothetical protein n=1 Tax=Paracholeplasma manati TaxID=591373 RepID=UPI0024081B95|nr:hypothetical protein [Paracholeplasma manati]MDG0889624.1 hypothetical protein [Paracholeplasma manati]